MSGELNARRRQLVRFLEGTLLIVVIYTKSRGPTAKVLSR